MRSMMVASALCAALLGHTFAAPALAASYTLAGSADGSAKFLVDDGIEIFRNGVSVYADPPDASSGLRGPIALTADVGDSLRFVLRDTFGTCAVIARIHLVDQLGRSTVAVPGFNGGCGNPPVDRGIVFETSFVIPDLTPDPPGYGEIQLKGSAFAGVVRGPGGFLYGATYDRRKADPMDPTVFGTLYRVDNALSAVDEEHGFAGADGSTPYAELTLAGTTFYGATSTGGASGAGTIFKFDPATKQLDTLVDFSFVGPYFVKGPLLVIGDWLYGSTIYGGATIFRVRTDGTDYETLHALAVTEGQSPGALVIGPDGWLYGAAEFGGIDCDPPVAWDGCGTVFRLRPEKDAMGSAQFQVLHSFTDKLVAYPQRKLFAGSDGRLYGATYRTLFTLDPDGSDFHTLYEVVSGSQIFTAPIEGLDGRIYVAQYDGGADGAGLVFSTDKTGTSAMPHHEFTFDADVAWSPYGILWQDKPGTIHGTTEYSGFTGNPGMVFQIRGLNPGPGYAAQIVDGSGGTVVTPDGSVEIVIPPGALSQPKTITIESGLPSSEFGVGTPSTRANVARIGPAGTTFAVPVLVRMKWQDTTPDDGRVDGLLTPELDLRVYRDGVAITTQCGFRLAPPKTCPDCCDTAANRWEVAVTGFSEFVLVSEPAPPTSCTTFADPKLTLGKVPAPTGDDTLSFKGSATLPPEALGMNPIAEGFAIELTDANGTVFDATLPAGAYTKATRTGWKVDRKGTKWTFTAPRGSGPAGIVRTQLQLKDGILKVTVAGALGAYAATPPLSVGATLPGDGTCLGTAFDVGEQACAVKNKGKTIACK